MTNFLLIVYCISFVVVLYRIISFYRVASNRVHLKRDLVATTLLLFAPVINTAIAMFIVTEELRGRR